MDVHHGADSDGGFVSGYVLCAPVGSIEPVAGSTVETCIECRQPVWVSAATKLLAAELHPAWFVCLPCAPTLADDGVELQVEPPTPAQLAEVAEHVR